VLPRFNDPYIDAAKDVATFLGSMFLYKYTISEGLAEIYTILKMGYKQHMVHTVYMDFREELVHIYPLDYTF